MIAIPPRCDVNATGLVVFRLFTLWFTERSIHLLILGPQMLTCVTPLAN